MSCQEQLTCNYLPLRGVVNSKTMIPKQVSNSVVSNNGRARMWITGNSFKSICHILKIIDISGFLIHFCCKFSTPVAETVALKRKKKVFSSISTNMQKKKKKKKIIYITCCRMLQLIRAYTVFHSSRNF